MTQPAPKAGVFIDVSVLIAATASPTGGSSLVLEICQGHQFTAQCSQRVLFEAQTNIRGKLSPDHLARFYQLLAALSPQLVSPGTPEEEGAYVELVGANDAHVVASAVRGAAAHLITLDRKHLANDTVRAADLPFQMLLPGEFIHLVLGARTSGGSRGWNPKHG